MEGFSSRTIVESGYCGTRGWVGETVSGAVCRGVWGAILFSLIGWRQDGMPNSWRWSPSGDGLHDQFTTNYEECVVSGLEVVLPVWPVLP